MKRCVLETVAFRSLPDLVVPESGQLFVAQTLLIADSAEAV